MMLLVKYSDKDKEIHQEELIDVMEEYLISTSGFYSIESTTDNIVKYLSKLTELLVEKGVIDLKWLKENIQLTDEKEIYKLKK